ncbi:MAG: flagellar FlbD family protein [Acidimicrobiales bacterium]
MIRLTRLDGSTLVVNADLIETIERGGDTVVSLVSGTRFVVRDGVEELIDAVVAFRARVLLAVEGDEAATVAPVFTLQPGRRGEPPL